MSTSWSGEWRARVRERARRLGYDGVLAFATSQEGVPLGQLFRHMRATETPDDIPIAYKQFVQVLFEEAEQKGILRDAIADSLVRSLRQSLAGGWNRGTRIPERRASVIAQWELPSSRISELSPIAQRVWEALKNLHPPD